MRPSERFGMRPRPVSRDFESRQTGCAQIGIENAGAAGADDVEGARHRKRRNRQPAGHGLEQNHPERIGSAREDENVGGRVDPREIIAFPHAQGSGRRDRPGAATRRRGHPPPPLSNQAGRATESGRGPSLAPDVRHTEKWGAAGPKGSRFAGLKRISSTPRDHCMRRSKTARGEFFGEGGGRDHETVASVVKAAQEPIGQRGRHRRTGCNVFGKPRVITRGEGQVPAQAIASRGMADRALGRDVNMVDRGTQPFQSGNAVGDAAHARQRQSDLAIGRERDGRKALRTQEFDAGVEGPRRPPRGIRGIGPRR